MGVWIPRPDDRHITARETGVDRSRRDGPHFDSQVHRRQLATPSAHRAGSPCERHAFCVRLCERDWGIIYEFALFAVPVTYSMACPMAPCKDRCGILP